MTIKSTIETIKTLQKGAYSLAVKYSREYNEIVISRKENGRIQSDTSYAVDLGHTKESKQDALNDAIATAKVMILLSPED